MSRQILGQQFGLEVLTRALAAGRFHHAWIFAGPRGVGKCTTAVELAKVLLDPEATVESFGGGEMSGGRRSRMIEAGTHPDLHVIRKELASHSQDAAVRSRKQTNIPIDVLREHMLGGEVGEKQMEAAAYRTSALGHGKVFIIDEAELLADAAQNALLKTLEEPPPRTYIILVTSQPDRLTATILSRCQHVRFHRLREDDMKTWAKARLSDTPASRRAWILDFAEGSPGMALRAVEFEFDRWQESLDPMLEALAEGEFPATMGALLGEMVENFAEAWVKSHANASKDAANKDGCGAVLSLLALHARGQLRRCASSHEDAQPWIRCIELLREAESQLWSNVNHKLVLENLVAQWGAALRSDCAVA